MRFLYGYKVSLQLTEVAGQQLSNLEEISYAISTAPPLPRGALPCPARAGSAEPGRKRQMPRRLRPLGRSRFRLTSEPLPTRPPCSPQGRRCCCRCCYCFPDSLPPTLPQPPPPPPPPPGSAVTSCSCFPVAPLRPTFDNQPPAAERPVGGGERRKWSWSGQRRAGWRGGCGLPVPV